MTRLRLLPLEQRAVPATFVVTSFDDLDPTGFDPTTGALPTGVVTLRSAVLAANANGQDDTITVPTAGYYRLSLVGANEDAGLTGDLDVTANVTFDFAANTVVEGTGLGDRLLDVPVGSATVVVNGGKFQSGSVDAVGPAAGGGVRSFGVLTLNNVQVSGNTVRGAAGAAGEGGGVWATNSLTLNGSDILGNQASGGKSSSSEAAGAGRGGGLYFTAGSLQLSDTSVSFNFADGGESAGLGGDAAGGGLFVDASTVVATDVRFESNSTSGGESFTAAASTGGSAFGGGASVRDSSLQLVRATVNNNGAVGGKATAQNAIGVAVGGTAYGGGLDIRGNSLSFDLRNVTVTSNLARGGGAFGTQVVSVGGQGFGGGLYLAGTGTSGGFIGNATITDNELDIGAGEDSVRSADGGGVYSDTFFPDFTVGSSIVAGNRGLPEKAATRDVAYNPANLASGLTAFTSAGSNLIGVSDGTAGFQNGVNNDQVGTAAAPIDPLLATLNSVGGSRRALVRGLRPGSPARDADFNAFVTTDQRGAAFPRGVNGRSDIGAFEVQVPAATSIFLFFQPVEGQAFAPLLRVTDPRFQPAGPVELFVNGVSVGTGTVGTNGTFVTVPGLPPGPAVLFFTYGGDANYLGVTSEPVTVTVLAASATTVSAAPSPAVENQPVTLTAVVTSPNGGTPAGGVFFSVDGVVVGGPVPLDANGVATLPLPAGLAAGGRTVTAAYGGSPTVAASAGTAALDVVVPTGTATTVNPNPAFVNQPLALTAVVSAANRVPTGSVTFSVNGTPAGTAAVDAAGVASLPVPAGLAAGTYTVTADYAPDNPIFVASSAPPATLAVRPAATATAAAVSPNPAFTSQPLTLAAAVTAEFGSPAGDVTFRLNGSAVGTAAADAAGNVTLPLPAGLAAGTYTLTADYAGTPALTASASPPVTLTVTPSPTTTALAVAPNSPTVGTPLTLTAAVAATFGTPTGSVTFFVNGQPVGSAAVDGSGRAVVTLSAGLPAGNYTLRADYAGVTGVFDPSLSPEQAITLARLTTSTAVTAAPNPVLATDPVTLTAAVTSEAGTPTGTVAFFLDGAAVGSAALDANGVATLALPDGVRIGDGSYAVDATYNGAPNFSSSFAPQGVLTVNPVPTRTTLTATPATAVQGTAVTLTANVAFAVNSPPGTAPVSPAIVNGTVNFFAGTTPLGSAPVANGVATLTATGLPVGANGVSAVFVPATADLLGSTGTAAVTVTAPPPVPREIFAVGTGYGVISVVRVYDADGNELTAFRPFGDDYWCGAVVATADVTGDGTEDVIVTAPLGAGPRVKVYDGTTFNVVADFFAYEPTFVGGASLAAGDLTGDGVAEFVTGAGPGGGPLVKVYSFVDGTVRLLNSFFAYADTLRSGVTVAVSGGLLATGPGYLGGPQVNVYAGADARPVTSFFAFDPASRDGVNVALGFDGTRTVLSAGSGGGEQPVLSAFEATTGRRMSSRTVYEPGYLGGVTVTAVRSAAGEPRTVVGTGLGGGPRVRIFGPGEAVVKDFFAADQAFRGGVFVG